MKKLLLLLFVPLVCFSSNEKIKAVIILGEGADKQEEIEYMEEIRLFLNDNNVIVKTFYDNDIKWEDIVKESRDASILIYQGHGILLMPETLG